MFFAFLNSSLDLSWDLSSAVCHPKFILESILVFLPGLLPLPPAPENEGYVKAWHSPSKDLQRGLIKPNLFEVFFCNPTFNIVTFLNPSWDLQLFFVKGFCLLSYKSRVLIWMSSWSKEASLISMSFE